MLIRVHLCRRRSKKLIDKTLHKGYYWVFQWWIKKFGGNLSRSIKIKIGVIISLLIAGILIFAIVVATFAGVALPVGSLPEWQYDLAQSLNRTEAAAEIARMISTVSPPDIKESAQYRCLKQNLPKSYCESQ